MKSILLLLSLLFIGCSGSLSKHNVGKIQYNDSIYKDFPIFRFEKDIVKLTSFDSTCSGFVVGDDLVLTAAHCIRKVPPYSLRRGTGEQLVWQKLAFIDRKVDIAIIKIKKTTIKSTLKIDASLEKPSYLYALGYPRGVNLPILRLLIPFEGYYDSAAQQTLIGVVEPGDSGGLLVDSRGNVFGILTAIMYDGAVMYTQAVRIAVISTVIQFIKGGNHEGTFTDSTETEGE